MHKLMLIAALLALLIAPVLAKDEDKPQPRTTSKAELRKLEKARKDQLKEREQRAKKNARSNAELGKNLEAVIDRWKDKGFQGAVLVAKDGKPILRKGYGMADREKKRANTPETLYDIGSITKMFTAAAVLRLEQDGKLRLEDKIGKWFAFAPEDKKPITLKQLLSHTSGLSMMYDEEVDGQSRDNTVRGLLGIKLSSEPGTQFEYSNANYYIAGAVVEIASGMKYEDYMYKHVIDALGLKDSAFCGSERLDDKRTAMRYEDGAPRGSVTDWPYSWHQRGVGYLVTTIDEMLKFSDAVEYSDFLDAEAKRNWHEVVKEPYALGWFVETRHGHKVHYHGGASPGAWAYFARYPDDDIMYVFFGNCTEQGKRIDLQIAAEIDEALFAG